MPGGGILGDGIWWRWRGGASASPAFELGEGVELSSDTGGVAGLGGPSSGTAAASGWSVAASLCAEASWCSCLELGP